MSSILKVKKSRSGLTVQTVGHLYVDISSHFIIIIFVKWKLALLCLYIAFCKHLNEFILWEI